jgi:protein-L-isoaspartate(D-aspartate) O-methyltransferase
VETSRLDERHVMVRDQLEKRGIRNPWLLQAMLDIPRHLFVPADYIDKAYEDGPLPIGHNQTISQPYIVASMIELIEPKSSDRVLEVGVGSGYSTAVLSQLVKAVYGIEKEPALLEEAVQKFKGLEFGNIHTKIGDGSLGWKEEAPFDAILVTAASPRIPPSLVAQLKVGGFMVIPIGSRESQKLVRILKRTETHFQEKDLYSVRFVPLIGQEGWSDTGRQPSVNG